MSLKSLKLSKTKILVIGDLMLDEYWIGSTNRISPEAPVPIVLVEHKDYRAGGAANVALNISGLGSEVNLLGIIGKDRNGEILQQILTKSSKIKNYINAYADQTTINKLRIISNGQQVFRLDQEKMFTPQTFDLLVKIFTEIIAFNSYDVIILSDYNKGTLQDPQVFINKANELKIPIIVDPKNANPELYKNSFVLTPNLKEFYKMVGISESKKLCQQELQEKGHNLIDSLNLQGLIITQGTNGLTVLTNNYQDQHFPAYAREVFDVTGAGDTVISTIGVALANNYNLHQAAHLATITAGIAVSKLGTSWVSIPEIEKELQHIEHNNDLNLGIITEEELIPIIQQRKSVGETIVLVNGCFDILHAGHIQYLENAKSYGDRLIVAINDDESIKILKGKERPINNLTHRMQVLAGLKAVDWVVAFGNEKELRPGRITSALNPDILIKSKEAYATIEEIPIDEGGPYVLENGGKIYLLDRPISSEYQISSTKIIEHIKHLIAIENPAYE